MFFDIFKTGELLEGVRNENLLTVKHGFPGNTMFKNKFVNADLSMLRKSFFTILPWALSINPQNEEKENEIFRLRTIPLNDLSKIKKDCMIWLGHCTFLFNISGKWILTDPCLTYPPYHERLSELPLPIESIRTDYLLISHGHFDHLDKATMELLPLERSKILVPLRMAKLLKKLNSNLNVQEAGWFQQYRLDENFRITFLPAHHWYLRVFRDYNKILWGSFLIEWNGKKIFFAGDSAYAAHFKEVYELFGPMDHCLMPIGAYAPARIMQDAHMNPEEAVRAFHDLHGKVLVPMHYGTFDLADEPLGEPSRRMKELEAEAKIDGKLIMPDIGEIIFL